MEYFHVGTYGVLHPSFLGEKEGWSTPYVPTWKWLEEVDDEVKRDLVGENLGGILNI